MDSQKLQEQGIHLPRAVSGDWKQELLESYSSAAELFEARLITLSELNEMRELADSYRVRLPKYYASLIEKDEAKRLSCPIRLQAIPSPFEQPPVLPDWAKAMSLKATGSETPWLADAIGDIAKLAAARLTHRYDNRAILHVSSLCAMYCRFCFRKTHLNEKEELLYSGEFTPAFEYLKLHGEIEEVILTGGDPLSIKDQMLAKLLDSLDEIAHIKTVRIHSRMLVTLPSRMSDELLDVLTEQRRIQVILVSHFNHPKELTTIVKQKVRQYLNKGVRILNQSVLLRNVNDSCETLRELFEGLYHAGIIPYYLHHPDWTFGTFGFRVPVEKGQALMRELQGTLSGPALPHYVLDLPQGFGKVSLMDAARVNLMETQIDDHFKGALYKITPPKTKTMDSAVTYLDLSLCRS